MKIEKVLVLNGSPKGNNSITLQTSKYLELIFGQLKFDYYNVGARIKALEKNMDEVISKIEESDLVIF
ncbi:MAG: iron-sulfur protein, partial [Clostridia bacterium]|nr:iron-sulfur protein [Clostridia bacterium]